VATAKFRAIIKVERPESPDDLAETLKFPHELFNGVIFASAGFLLTVIAITVILPWDSWPSWLNVTTLILAALLLSAFWTYTFIKVNKTRAFKWFAVVAQKAFSKLNYHNVGTVRTLTHDEDEFVNHVYLHKTCAECKSKICIHIPSLKNKNTYYVISRNEIKNVIADEVNPKDYTLVITKEDPEDVVMSAC